MVQVALQDDSQTSRSLITTGLDVGKSTDTQGHIHEAKENPCNHHDLLDFKFNRGGQNAQGSNFQRSLQYQNILEEQQDVLERSKGG